MGEKYARLKTMLRLLRGSYPISEEWRSEILDNENVCPLAIINCNGGRVIKDRDFIFGYRVPGVKPRFFTVVQRETPTEDGKEWDVAPIDRDDAIERCFREDSAMIFTQSKKPPPLWAYNFLVSVCQLTKESFSIV